MKDTRRQLETKYSQILRERANHADQSVEEFCSDQGINPWTYYHWKKKLQLPLKNPAVQKKFLPVQLIGPTAAAVSNDTGIKYEIKFPNGITLRLSGALHGKDHAAVIGSIAGFRP